MEVTAVCESLSESFAQDLLGPLSTCIKVIVLGLISSGFDERCHLLTSLLSTSILASLISSGAIFFHALSSRNEHFLSYLTMKYLRKVTQVDFETIFRAAIQANISYETLLRLLHHYMLVHNIREYNYTIFPFECYATEKRKIEIKTMFGWKYELIERNLSISAKELLFMSMACQFTASLHLLRERICSEYFIFPSKVVLPAQPSMEFFDVRGVEDIQATLIFELCRAAQNGKIYHVELLASFLAEKDLLLTFLSCSYSTAPESLLKNVVDTARRRGVQLVQDQDMVNMVLEAGRSADLIAIFMGCVDGHTATAIPLAYKWQSPEILAALVSIFKYSGGNRNRLQFLDSCISSLEEFHDTEFASTTFSILLSSKSGLIMDLSIPELARAVDKHKHIISTGGLWNLFALMEKRLLEEPDHQAELVLHPYVADVLHARWIMRHLNAAKLTIPDICALIVRFIIEEKS